MAATKDKTKAPERWYLVLTGCDVGNGYHEPGSVINTVPPEQVRSWLDEKVIELTDAPKDAA